MGKFYIDSEVAKVVGVNAAFLFQNISYWVSANEHKKSKSHYRDGRYWTYGTVKDYEEIFNFLSHKQIWKALDDLVSKKFIERRFYSSSRVSWYTIGENGLKFHFPSKENEIPSKENEIPSRENEIPSRENEIPSRENEIPSRENPYTDIDTYKDTDKTTDVISYKDTDKDVSSSLSSSQRDIEYNEIKDEEIKEILNSKLLTPKQVKALLIRINKTSLCGYVEKAQQYISEGGKYRDVFATFSKWVDEDTSPKPNSADFIGEQIEFKRKLIASMKVLEMDITDEERQLKELENRYGSVSFKEEETKAQPKKTSGKRKRQSIFDDDVDEDAYYDMSFEKKYETDDDAYYDF